MEQETQKIDHMVKEIIALEPELAANEKAVRQMVMKLYSERPLVSPDKHFVEELRAQLKLEMDSTPKTQQSFIQKIDNVIGNMKWQYGLAGAFVLLLAIVPFLGDYGSQRGGTVQIFSESHDTLGKMAFGDLGSTEGVESGVSAMNASPEMAGADMAAPAPRMAVQEGVTSMMVTETVGDVEPGFGGENKMAVSPMIMPRPDYALPQYVFDGVLPAIPASDDVYRKKDVSINTSGISGILKRMDLGLMDINSFAGLDIQRLELVSRADAGYIIRVDLERGEISINRDWRQMAQREWNENSGVLVGDINESKMFQIAEAFLSKHGIALDEFGDPILDMSWYRDENSRLTQLNVRFPRLIEGKPVFEVGGNVQGLTVSIDLIDMVVSGVWGLESESYEKSSYPLITDTASIEKLVEMGGMRHDVWIQSETDAKKVRVNVGDPQMGLMHTWKYENKESYELYVPALIFPVINAAEARALGAHVNNAIVVPLVEGLLDQDEDRPMPMPMPAVMRDGGMTEPAIMNVEEVNAEIR